MSLKSLTMTHRLAIALALAPATMWTGAAMAQSAQAVELRPLVGTIIPVPDPVPMKEGLAELPNGAKLWYSDTGGDGEAVVFAHPRSGNHTSWMYQQPVFAKAGYRMIAYSRRGHYKSEPGPADDKGSQAEDLALLLDSLGIAKAHLVGVAAGGSTVLDFALSYPERAISASIVSSVLSIAEPDYRAAMQSARGEWFEALDPQYRELSASFRVVYPDGVKLWQEVYDRNPADMPRQPTTTKITWDKLKTNTVPLLLATGGADIYQPPELLLRTAERIPSATVHIFEKSGHPVFAEYPDAFNTVVLDFIAAH